MDAFLNYGCVKQEGKVSPFSLISLIFAWHCSIHGTWLTFFCKNYADCFPMPSFYRLVVLKVLSLQANGRGWSAAWNGPHATPTSCACLAPFVELRVQGPLDAPPSPTHWDQVLGLCPTCWDLVPGPYITLTYLCGVGWGALHFLHMAPHTGIKHCAMLYACFIMQGHSLWGFHGNSWSFD